MTKLSSKIGLSGSSLIKALSKSLTGLEPSCPLSPDNEAATLSLDEKLDFFYSIVDQSSSSIVITDVGKHIIYVNKKFEQVSGFSLEEVLGKNPRVIKSQKTPISTYVSLNQSLLEKRQWSGLFVNVDRDGKEYIEEAIVSPIYNNHGDVFCYLAEKKDITKLKVAEDAVQKLTYFDPLTELPNRAYFIEDISMLVNSQSISGFTFSILFADLNRFKELNDTHGHIAGDIALYPFNLKMQV